MMRRVFGLGWGWATGQGREARMVEGSSQLGRGGDGERPSVMPGTPAVAVLAGNVPVTELAAGKEGSRGHWWREADAGGGTSYA